MNLSTYTFFSDAGHGWLQVPRTELASMGLADKITSYSYQRNGYVYLEEDCDLSTFLNAMRAAGREYKIVEAPHVNDSPIRNYPRFSL